VESSIINSLMMPQIAILAFLFLGESLTVKEIVGLVLVSLGVVVVQLQKRPVQDQTALPTSSEAS
jgi:drug/metabolite transporter (DMT)-like permease